MRLPVDLHLADSLVIVRVLLERALALHPTRRSAHAIRVLAPAREALPLRANLGALVRTGAHIAHPVLLQTEPRRETAQVRLERAQDRAGWFRVGWWRGGRAGAARALRRTGVAEGGGFRRGRVAEPVGFAGRGGVVTGQRRTRLRHSTAPGDSSGSTATRVGSAVQDDGG